MLAKNFNVEEKKGLQALDEDRQIYEMFLKKIGFDEKQQSFILNFTKALNVDFFTVFGDSFKYYALGVMEPEWVGIERAKELRKEFNAAFPSSD